MADGGATAGRGGGAGLYSGCPGEDCRVGAATGRGGNWEKDLYGGKWERQGGRCAPFIKTGLYCLGHLRIEIVDQLSPTKQAPGTHRDKERGRKEIRRR